MLNVTISFLDSNGLVAHSVHLAGRMPRGFRMSTNRNGFSALEIPIVPMSATEAFEAYEWPGPIHVVVSDNAADAIWEGRLEDIAIIPEGISLTAFGYQRAMQDAPYTALWSKSGSGDWDELTTDDASTYKSQQWEMDNNNRLYFAPRKGEQFVSGTDMGGMTYLVPNRGERDITNFSFNYDVTLPTDWKLEICRDSEVLNITNVEDTITGNGSQQTGSKSITLSSPAERLIVRCYNDTGGAATVSTDSGDTYAKLTSIRIKTTTKTSVLASDIVIALATFVNGVNTTQLSPITDRIQATDVDLYDELYEDEYPAVILERLAESHNYEWAVWDDKKLFFHEQGTEGREWYVDVTNIIELQRSLDNVRNSAYGVYKDSNGRLMRTANATDTDSITRFGITRRGYVDVQTTSSTQAETHRTAWLSDRAGDALRARVEFEYLLDTSGYVHPLYSIRAGDTLTMRNLSPTLSTGIDRIRSFIVAETEYDAERDEISLSPKAPTPTLVTLVAKRGKAVTAQRRTNLRQL